MHWLWRIAGASGSKQAVAPRWPVRQFSKYGPSCVRLYSTQLDSYEQKLYDMLQTEFKPTKLEVKDVSGGCGSMFAISIVSPQFKGKSMVNQHRLVNKLLADEIARWHGLQLRTSST